MNKVKNALNKSFTNNKIAHAYIFEGPAGAKKRETAFWMTKRFLCSSLKGNTACGVCAECKRVDSINHPDVHLIEPDGQSIKIEQIRSLQKEFAYKGVETDKKVYIIQDVDKMTNQAANCLLKFLEEPNGETLAILLTERKNRLLPTIISRCQLYTFSPLQEKDLEKIYSNKGISRDKRVVLSKVTSDVDYGLALMEDNWLDKALGNIANFLNEYLLDPYSALIYLQSEWVDFFSDKKKQQLGLDLLLLAFKDMSQLGIKRPIVLSHLIPVYEQWYSRFSLVSILEIIEELLESKGKLQSNSSFLMIVENICYRIISLEKK